jgi:hypothetical protein
MTSALKSALPAHLKSSLGNGDANAEFARKHHGKTQSHMVSAFQKASTNDRVHGRLGREMSGRRVRLLAKHEKLLQKMLFVCQSHGK